MDLTKPVVYRGLDLNSMATVETPAGAPLSGYMLKRIQYSDVQGEGYREKRSLADGYDAGSVYLGFRPVNLQGEVYGASRADLWDNLQRLRRVLTPTLAYADGIGDLGFMDLHFFQPTGHTTDWPLVDFPDGIPLVMRLRPQAQPSFVVDGDRGAGPDEYGFLQTYQAQLWARDPLIYVKDPTIIPMSGATASGVYVNRGDYPAPLNFELLVNNKDQKTFHFTGCNTDFTVTIPSVGSDANRLVRVDSTLKVVTYQVGGSTVENLRMDLIDFKAGKTWPRVLPSPASEDNYTWTMTGGGLIVGSQAFIEEAFA